MANLQYIGARYVPKFYLNPDDQSNDWKSGVLYEALMIVTYNNDSYTSKKVVPDNIGNPADNPEFWACTTKYTAALMALQTTVQNMEDFIGDIPLETIAQTLSGAINENFDSIASIKRFKEFEALRVGSYVGALPNNVGQSMVKIGTSYFCAGGAAGGTYFTIDELDSDFNIITSRTYSVSCHPNDIFYFNNKIYVVSSSNDIIYVINKTTMAIEEQLTLGVHFTTGCVDENGVAYLGNANEIYKFNSDHSFDLIATFDSIENSALFVNQTFIVYEKCVFRIQNRPNMIVVFNLDGKLLGTIDVGIGNGFYPYGELENFFWDNGEICMLTAPYVTNESRPFWLPQVFKTNIVNDLTNDSTYGQMFPADLALIVDNTHAHVKNADGTSARPFSTLFEASMVYNYLMSIGMAPNSYIQIDGGTYTNDCLLLQNIVANIRFNATKGALLVLYNCECECRGLNFENAIIRRSNVHFIGGTFDEFHATYSVLDFHSVTVKGSNNTISQSAIKGLMKWSATNSSMTSNIIEHHVCNRTAVNISSATPAALNADEIISDTIYNSNANKIEFIFGCGLSSGLMSRGAVEFAVILGNTELSALRNSSQDITSKIPVLLYDNTNSKYFTAVVVITFKYSDKSIMASTVDPEYLDGTPVTGFGNINLGEIVMNPYYLSLSV